MSKQQTTVAERDWIWKKEEEQQQEEENSC